MKLYAAASKILLEFQQNSGILVTAKRADIPGRIQQSESQDMADKINYIEITKMKLQIKKLVKHTKV
jgi:hypothetical protein